MNHMSAYDQVKIKIRIVVSGVISATQSESVSFSRIRTFPFSSDCLRLRRLRSAYDLVKTRLSESEAEAEG